MRIRWMTGQWILIRKWLSILLVAFVCWTITAVPLCATDPTPCEPCVAGSVEQTYGALDSTTISIGPGCLIKVFFKTRNCGGCWDVKITGMQQVVPCPPPLDIDRIVTLAIGRVVFSNEMNFPPYNIGEGACWRVTRPKCWRKGEESCNNEPQPFLLLGCDSTECCTSLIFAYRNNCDNIQLRDGDESMYNGEGQGFTNQFNGECNRCDSGGSPMPGSPVTCLNTCDTQFLMNYLQEESSP